MNPLILLPIIEALLSAAPTIIADVEKIIAALKGKPQVAGNPVDVAKIMADMDAKLAAFK